MKRRVVVTGMGCVTPFGLGVDVLWNNLINGKSGITPLSLDKEKHLVHIGGHVPDFNADEYVESKDARRMDKFILCSVVAATLAMNDANFDLDKEDLTRFGVIAGSAAGGLETIEKNHTQMLSRGYYKCSPFMVPMMISNMAAGKISIKFGFKGMSKAVVTACATGAHSIGDAMRAIQYGDADVMLAGGAEAGICDIGVGAFTAARTLSKSQDEPSKVSRPFDIKRDGFVLSEGAGIIVLEERERAIKRGAKIYAELVGYGQSSDAYDMVAPDPSGAGAALAINLALKDASLNPSDIDYINAHGTSTHVGDLAESRAIEKVFGDKTKNAKLSVSSTKSMTGHMLGGAGAVEAIISIKAIKEGIVPPTINLDEQDPEVANLDFTPNIAKRKQMDIALSNSFGFGGCNAVLIFKK